MAGLTVTARSDSAEYRAQTADNGLYGFQGLPSGRYQLSVAAPPGRRAFWRGNAEHPGASPRTPCAMNFEVFWDGLIIGTVLGRDGQPASGMITAQYAGPETQPAGPFGAYVKDGRFEILRLPPGRYRLMFLPIVADRPAGPPVYYPGTPATKRSSSDRGWRRRTRGGAVVHYFLRSCLGGVCLTCSCRPRLESVADWL